tara:strand:+ start:535 stop:705 length:171 start_codon:yes stop_codon:yes gene_type:complete
MDIVLKYQKQIVVLGTAFILFFKDFALNMRIKYKGYIYNNIYDIGIAKIQYEKNKI